MPGQHDKRHAEDADIHQVLAYTISQSADPVGTCGQHQRSENTGDNAAIHT